MNSPEKELIVLFHIGLASQKTRWHDAHICLGETRTDAFNRFDLCYSLKVLCQAEYGGTRQLHHAAKNYARNYGAKCRTTPEPAHPVRTGTQEFSATYVFPLCQPFGMHWLPRGPPDFDGA